MSYTIGNMHKTKEGIYVGRPTPLGNPFIIGRDGDREEVIQKYETWFYEQVDSVLSATDTSAALNRQLRAIRECHKLRGTVRLLCWCSPLPCHADVIREYLEDTDADLDETHVDRAP